MTNIQITKQNNSRFDLEDRTLEFSKRIVRLCKELPRNTINHCLVEQIIRSAGSMGANYREANDALGRKDFTLRVRIARKETKETLYWLELIIEANPEFKTRMENLVKECIELKKILSVIVDKSK